MKSKKVVRLTESRLRSIINKSVYNILKEHFPYDEGGYALEIINKLKEASDLMNDYMMTQEYGHQFVEASELIKRAISLIKRHKNDIVWGLDVEDYEDDDTFGQF